jgi:hypothetical protein
MTAEVPTNPYDNLLAFLMKLDDRKIHFALKQIRPESILVDIAVPGERWEVEFMQDGSVEIERFVSDGSIDGRERLDDLFARFSD